VASLSRVVADVKADVKARDWPAADPFRRRLMFSPRAAKSPDDLGLSPDNFVALRS
jgi:hypothetical protein